MAFLFLNFNTALTFWYTFVPYICTRVKEVIITANSNN